MTITSDDSQRGYTLARDSFFQEAIEAPHPPQWGEITAIDATTGQLTIDIGQAEDALAWPVNGDAYSVGDSVFVIFSSPSPGSGVAIGSK